MTDEIVETAARAELDALVCIGGGGTQKNALRLVEGGLNVITLPKTIDNDVAKTDATIGFATALEVATDAIDRLHSTAHSHHRIIVAELMGHSAGWLALGAGIAGGADVILIPEIPYSVARSPRRSGARPAAPTSASSPSPRGRALEDAWALAPPRARAIGEGPAAREAAEAEVELLDAQHAGNTLRLPTGWSG